MSTAVLPPLSRSASTNNIVDLTDDDIDLPTPVPKRRRANNGRAVPVASHDVVIIESDDEDEISLAGPSGEYHIQYLNRILLKSLSICTLTIR